MNSYYPDSTTYADTGVVFSADCSDVAVYFYDSRTSIVNAAWRWYSFPVASLESIASRAEMAGDAYLMPQYSGTYANTLYRKP